MNEERRNSKSARRKRGDRERKTERFRVAEALCNRRQEEEDERENGEKTTRGQIGERNSRERTTGQRQETARVGVQGEKPSYEGYFLVMRIFAFGQSSHKCGGILESTRLSVQRRPYIVGYFLDDSLGPIRTPVESIFFGGLDPCFVFLGPFGPTFSVSGLLQPPNFPLDSF